MSILLANDCVARHQMQITGFVDVLKRLDFLVFDTFVVIHQRFALTIDIEHRRAALTQIDSYILHIEAGMVWCAVGQELNPLVGKYSLPCLLCSH